MVYKSFCVTNAATEEDDERRKDMLNFDDILEMKKLDLFIRKRGFRPTIDDWYNTAAEIEPEQAQKLLRIKKDSDEIPNEELNLDQVRYFLKKIFNELNFDESRKKLVRAKAITACKG